MNGKAIFDRDPAGHQGTAAEDFCCCYLPKASTPPVAIVVFWPAAIRVSIFTLPGCPRLKINQVERFFRLITEDTIRRGVFCSVADRADR